jgi:hypothetical protein
MEPNTSLNPVPSQGPVVGIIVVVIVLIVAGFFFFTRLWAVNEPMQFETATTSDNTIYAPVSSSDDPDAIASDLDNEDFSDIDAELDAIDAELNQ